MKIYLDYIFLENIVINIIIITETIVFTNTKITKKRKYIIILLDSILSVFVVIYKLNIAIRIIMQCTILYFLFKEKNKYVYIKKSACYFVLYALYMGTIISLTLILKLNLEYEINKIILYLISGLFFHIFTKDMWKVWKIKLTKRDICYNLEINGNKILAFVDTGNRVKDMASSLDVIFILEDLKDKILNGSEEKINLNISTINGNTSKEAYIVKNVIVYKGEKQVAILDKIIISFSNIKSSTPEKYSAIIGYETYLNNLEGVVL